MSAAADLTPVADAADETLLDLWAEATAEFRSHYGEGAARAEARRLTAAVVDAVETEIRSRGFTLDEETEEWSKP